MTKGNRTLKNAAYVRTFLKMLGMKWSAFYWMQAAGSAVSAEEALRIAPEEGIRDLAVIEAFLKSSDAGGALVAVEQIS